MDTYSYRDREAYQGSGFFESLVDLRNLRTADLVLRAVNHKLRQRLIDLLKANEQMTVTDIYIKMRLEQSVASQHLGILRRAGIVKTERQGKFIYYKLNHERLQFILKTCKKFANLSDQ